MIVGNENSKKRDDDMHQNKHADNAIWDKGQSRFDEVEFSMSSLAGSSGKPGSSKDMMFLVGAVYGWIGSSLST